MTPAFERFVRKIVQSTDASEEEQEELIEELCIHLELTKEQLIKDHYTEQEAIRLAMERFGEEKEIGQAIQQAMYPYRRQLMFTLSVLSILAAVSIYLVKLFGERDAHILWLLLAMVSSTSLLTFTLQPILHRRRWFNTLFIVHLFIYLYGGLIATSATMRLAWLTTLLAWGIVCLSVVLIYHTTILGVQKQQHNNLKLHRIYHLYNLTIGLVAVGTTIFLLWVFLVFSTSWWGFFIAVAPVIIWMFLYWLQFFLLNKGKSKQAIVVGSLQLLFFLWFFFIWFR